MKKLLLCALLAVSSVATAKSEYFYFWADSYKTYLDSDDSAFVLMNLKTSKTKKFDISVNDKIVAKDFTVFADEITQFPIQVSKKYTTGKHIDVCALMQDESSQFQNVVCSRIEIMK